MGTLVAVDAGFSQAQPLHRTSSNKVLLDDLLNVAGMHIAVPDGLRINNDDRAMLALIQAA
jgi:hypothetical protein